MAVETLNLQFEQSQAFSFVIAWLGQGNTANNLTGYTASMPIVSSAGTTALTLSTANGKITLGGSAGTIALTATTGDTGGLVLGDYTYTLTLTPPLGPVPAFPFISGHISVAPVADLVIKSEVPT